MSENYTLWKGDVTAQVSPLGLKEFQDAAKYLDDCSVKPEDMLMMTARTAEEMVFIIQGCEDYAKAQTAAYLEDSKGNIIYVFDDENGERQRVRVSLVYVVEQSAAQDPGTA